MWCSNCQQDVPAIAALHDERKICCARCRREFGRNDSSDVSTLATDPSEKELDLRIPSPGSRPPLPDVDWELEEDLRSAQRLLRTLKGGSPSRTVPVSAPTMPVGPHYPFAFTAGRQPDPRAVRLAREANRPGPARSAAKSGITAIAWVVLSLGLMAFVCGAVLLGWGIATDRGELWSLGMPVSLIGQAALVIGLVLQLDGLWQSNRHTTHTLDELDEQLEDLRHNTTLMSASHSSAAQSFYAHMAQGANPDLLLADVKGQLDLLAMRLSNERR